MNEDPKQALIEVLFLALYLDNHLSLLEDDVLERALASLGWTAGERDAIDVGVAFARAREAGKDELQTEDFLKERAAILKASDDADLAVSWLGRLLNSDGMTVGEGRFLERFSKLVAD